MPIGMLLAGKGNTSTNIMYQGKSECTSSLHKGIIPSLPHGKPGQSIAHGFSACKVRCLLGRGFLNAGARFIVLEKPDDTGASDAVSLSDRGQVLWLGLNSHSIWLVQR